jgi:hypothetical protein
MGILALFRWGAFSGVAIAAVLFFYKTVLWFLASYEIWILGGSVSPNQLYPAPSLLGFVFTALFAALVGGVFALLFRSRLERMTN